ncbi:Uncharacterised protein [Mycolicibacterium phlei]|uniref:Uncharacterized protein n=1 Tax=Mycolicibacterium phlei DSM 43239 = CCUG 21000 TaxID=1226750 RepID=A0A5N5V6G1_MYCPH|nr:hypothetical protein [Mycolicibacterium phlei]VEG07211.1 Uncharacterised protein [Mycobacteroides chelonae]AMO59079.1 hypothetical protein MPHLCCUG_00234 [Mycolicibacterium phlei]KAB7757258.1 hypothetical protein MPHL21000_08410 [Mycolicibacterium phlei DSM 43239 = CCUG 21000]KXW65470.1 hypothetical protein MPHL43239_10500 [Mycolicibacterium phlei DSM 43239 = CCUG 21000]KXW72253.1 hypothetical protein MPHL43072_00340 [Mycolicibacterium phlei DSM 43072]
MSYLDHTAAAQAKAHSYVYEALGLNPLDEIPDDDHQLRNDYDARLKAFLAGVFWALDELPNEAEG